MAGPLQISDNALMRWLERTGAIDVDQLKRILATALQRAYVAGASINAGEFLILSAGLVYVIRDGTLITVLEEDGRHKHVRYLTSPHRDVDPA